MRSVIFAFVVVLVLVLFEDVVLAQGNSGNGNGNGNSAGGATATTGATAAQMDTAIGLLTVISDGLRVFVYILPFFAFAIGISNGAAIAGETK